MLPVSEAINWGECSVAQDVMREEENELLLVLEKNQTPHRLTYFDGAIRQHFEIVGSTHHEARQLSAICSPKEWVVLSADEQTVGVGTHGRSWFSPSGSNLYVSFVVPFPQQLSEKLFFISQVTAIATARTLKRLGLEPKIKWPNDLMLNGKKVCGILCETTVPVQDEAPYALLIGVGLNVNMEKSLCEGLDQPVTSLLVEAERTFDTEQILKSLYHDLRNCIDELLYCGFSGLQKELNSMLAFKEQKVTIERDFAPPVEGHFVGIDEMGRLQLRSDDGQVLTLDQGRIRRT